MRLRTLRRLGRRMALRWCSETTCSSGRDDELKRVIELTNVRRPPRVLTLYLQRQ